MARDFRELEERMSPEARARAQAKADELINEMFLAEIRQSLGLTQAQLAEELGISQPALSKIENQDDMQLSTLRRIIEAMGGELEIVAHLPKGDIRVRAFRHAS
jgi:DNA-binding XRE family transcriptional regulator